MRNSGGLRTLPGRVRVLLEFCEVLTDSNLELRLINECEGKKIADFDHKPAYNALNDITAEKELIKVELMRLAPLPTPWTNHHPSHYVGVDRRVAGNLGEYRTHWPVLGQSRSTKLGMVHRSCLR